MSLICGDARRLPIASGVVQCCVTSPPYWGLRDYGTATWSGGDPACDHKGAPQQSGASTLAGNGHGAGKPLSPQLQAMAVPFRETCGKCGAARTDRQLGLEASPEEYVGNLVAVFREVARVMRDDGTVWLNLGDSYANDTKWGGSTSGKHVQAVHGGVVGSRLKSQKTGLKPKDLVGIPWRVAFALQADGWYLRSDVIWSKPNPMPESVTDRPTKSHEYVFLLTKGERYYWDAEAVKEPAVCGGDLGLLRRPPAEDKAGVSWHAQSVRTRQAAGVDSRTAGPVNRNIRSVWLIATQPYSGAHFATMPEALASRCILAGTRPGDWVLDPFLGSGTVARRAITLGRRAVGCDLNRAYLRLADERTHVTRGLPLELEVGA